ncbi:hypothetical protein [Pedobacter agri]|uniref:Uncharacterized protein n=1 Tax=Pedobacter agri TaxID=454586 RepID=A0A9X3DG03_9SPHI|nr:hypothetical protein [Pedobacter agri]MCX3266557.1 hypothetical protein [Pedobacter agri]MDQ1139446.1 Pyruvate/2-oxoacid:ferredoxin oxidoreductase gamma subunit [Pedobacter agri]
MKFGFKNMLGLGFMAALMGLSGKSQATENINAKVDEVTHNFNKFASPMWAGKSQRKGKSNRKRLSHNAKLKRRRAA